MSGFDKTSHVALLLTCVASSPHHKTLRFVTLEGSNPKLLAARPATPDAPAARHYALQRQCVSHLASGGGPDQP